MMLRLQRKADGAAAEGSERGRAGGAPGRTTLVEQALGGGGGGGGEPVPAAIRGRAERTMGQDLSGVRVHAGGEAAASAASVGALAFTVGQDIHFGAGRFAPG